MAEGQGSVSTFAKGAVHVSKRLVTSYVIDWIFILAIAAIGAVFNRIDRSNHRPFSLQDPSISYPYKPDTVSVTVLLIVALIAPGVITLVVAFLFIPGPTAAKSTPKALIWRRKFWEWNCAWMGLGMALATAFMMTEGLKDLGGKPRPHAIAVCRPDTSAESIARYRVGGLGVGIDQTGATPILVSYDICQERDPQVLRDAFASWPSGHSSFSCAGMVYLSLFLCAKFAVSLPFLGARSKAKLDVSTFDDSPESKVHSHFGRTSSPLSEDKPQIYELGKHATFPPRNQAAPPPVYLLILAVYVPIGTAIFICVSRWFDFHHHGIDIFSGALIGTFSAYLSFRYYHMPIRRGAGWAWGARSRSRAFWLGVGREGYVGTEGWEAKKFAIQRSHDDLESGNKTAHEHEMTGPGIDDRAEQQGSSKEPQSSEPAA